MPTNAKTASVLTRLGVIALAVLLFGVPMAIGYAMLFTQGAASLAYFKAIWHYLAG